MNHEQFVQNLDDLTNIPFLNIVYFLGQSVEGLTLAIYDMNLPIDLAIGRKPLKTNELRFPLTMPSDLI
jgi:hypothetical protein